MNLFKWLFFLVILSSCSTEPSQAQSNTTTFSFKKGEILDLTIILEKENINKDSLFGIYRKVLFPIAMEYSFQPAKGFAVKETLQGGYQPNVMALGKWGSLKQRLDFMVEVVKRVPAFHDMRRGLWDSFDVTYYEMKDNLSFTVNTTEHNVATAYWLDKESKGCNSFINQWEELCLQEGGKVITQLQDGGSPSGYYYNPTYYYTSVYC